MAEVLMPEPWDDPRITTYGLLLESHAAIRSAMAPTSLPMPWLEVLLRLARSGGRLRMAELADQVRLSASGLTRLVDRVEAAGLVRREACTDDRRGWFAVLTPAGEAALRADLPGHVESIQRHVVDVLGDDLPRLESLLRRLRDAADARQGDDRDAEDRDPEDRDQEDRDQEDRDQEDRREASSSRPAPFQPVRHDRARRGEGRDDGDRHDEATPAAAGA